jgi:hypothetical protein
VCRAASEGPCLGESSTPFGVGDIIRVEIVRVGVEAMEACYKMRMSVIIWRPFHGEIRS